jgi:hypothetical protein
MMLLAMGPRVISANTPIACLSRVFAKQDGRTVELTDRCYEVDRVTGVARCFVRDEEGRLVLTDDHSLAREDIAGAWIEPRPGETWESWANR